ncbi:hypothetical protein BCR44DRAFT_1440892 [Catenaria anguillulae PL171]|uniref:Uncharacterized protein n=1 Tax=Catenaria anguillulae PL171 TaxID=765915 RepID=A0A1Y2HC60_9FUNG|nr:hypothetical protein BCR44DRAFT_1440892 [Catenaria anguillulae PL171]
MIVPPQEQQPAAVAKVDDPLSSPGVARLASLRIQRTESLDLSTTDLSKLSASPRPPSTREIQQPPAKRHAGSGSSAINVPGGPGWMGDTGAPEQAEVLATSPRSRGLARHVFADFTHVPYGANPIGTTALARAPHSSATTANPSATTAPTSATTTTTARGTKRPASWSLQSTADALLRETLSRPDTGVAEPAPPMGSRREMLDFPLLHMMGGVPHGFGESGFRHSFVGVAPIPPSSSSASETKSTVAGTDSSWTVDANGNPLLGANPSSSSSAATLAGGMLSHISLPSLTNLSMLSQSSSSVAAPAAGTTPMGPAAASVQPTPPLSATSSDIKSPSSFMSFSPNLGGTADSTTPGPGARRGAGNLVRIPSHLSYASSLIASPTLDSFEGAAAVAMASVSGLGMGQQEQGQQQHAQQVQSFSQSQPTMQHSQPPPPSLVQQAPAGPGQPTMLKLQPIVNPDGSTTIRLPPGFVLAPGPPPPQPNGSFSANSMSLAQHQFAPAAVPQFVVLPHPQQQDQPGQAQGQAHDLSSWTQVVPGLTQVGMMTAQNGAYMLR